MAVQLTLVLRPETLAIVRLPSGEREPVPGWAFAGDGIAAVVRRGPELSVVCPAERVPAGAIAERGWQALEVDGPLDFALTGIVVSIAGPLADAGIPIFALSTYDTDVVLVRDQRISEAITALEGAGHRVSRLS